MRRASVLGTPVAVVALVAALVAVAWSPAAEDRLAVDAAAGQPPETTVVPPGGTVALAAVATAGSGACRLGPPGTPCGVAPLQVPQPVGDPDRPGCPEGEARAAVVDKAAQRFWLCEFGLPATERLRMTSGSLEYGLPPVGTYDVFARNSVAWGIHGERLNRFVAFYTTPRGNRIAFHEYVNQTEESIGELDMRGDSSGCLRVSTADSWLVWDFLEIGDPVVVITD